MKKNLCKTQIKVCIVVIPHYPVRLMTLKHLVCYYNSLKKQNHLQMMISEMRQPLKTQMRHSLHNCQESNSLSQY